MSHSDPTSRRLRGAIGAASRDGRLDDERALRRELALSNVERALVRELNGTPLSAAELHRLRLALESHGPRRTPVTNGAA